MRQNQGDQSILYIFGCIEEGCGGGQGSWKVYRWTQELVCNSDMPVEDTKEDKPEDAWGLDDTDDGDFDFADLQEQLKSLSQPSTIRKEKRDTTSVTEIQYLFDGRLPSFYLVQSEHMPQKLNRNFSDDDDDDDIAERDGAPGGSFGVDEDTEDTGDAGIVSWDGEQYENDSILRGTGQSSEDDASFIRFMRQLSVVPDQCMRVYDVDTDDKNIPYLWPSKGIQETLCSACGSPRICVLQCMSPIIAALDEARDMTGSPDSYKSPPFSWNWATLAVSVCKSLCAHSTLIEEHLDVLGEA